MIGNSKPRTSDRPPRGVAQAGQCVHKKKDGSRCRAGARTGKRHCFFHDPDTQAAAAAAGRLGGLATTGARRPAPAATLPEDTPDAELRTVADVVAVLGATINQVRTGRLAVGVANSIGILAGTLLKALQAGDLEQRLAVLESGRAVA